MQLVVLGVMIIYPSVHRITLIVDYMVNILRDFCIMLTFLINYVTCKL